MGKGTPLSDRLVKAIKPPAKGQRDVVDRGYPGLALRVSYGGGKSWVFFYRLSGKGHRLTFGTYPAMTLAEARAAWRVARELVQAGQDPRRSSLRADANSFEAVFRDWLKRDQAGHKSMPDVQGRIEMYTLDRNPVADLPKPGAETRRDRVLTDDELAVVWRAAEEMGFSYGDAIKLLILTGARREEINRLRWSEIHGDEIVLESARTKTGAANIIPLSAPARDIIAKLPRFLNGAYLFGASKPPRGWSQARGRIDQIAKLATRWTIHDLRRTCATVDERTDAPLSASSNGHHALKWTLRP